MSSPRSINSIEIIGLHHNTDVRVQLQSHLNLIYGQNGSGKTTVLHFLANLAETDLDRLRFTAFSTCRVQMSDGGELLVKQHRHDDGSVVALSLSIDGRPIADLQKDDPTPYLPRAELRQFFGGRPVYLPAFRPILEAASRDRLGWHYRNDSRLDSEMQLIAEQEGTKAGGNSSEVAPRLRSREDHLVTAFKTVLCRDWFGQFVPVVRFPSLAEVAGALRNELQNALLTLAEADRAAFSDVFEQALRSVLSHDVPVSSASVEQLLEGIRESLQTLRGQDDVLTGAPDNVYARVAALVKELERRPQGGEEMTARILTVYARAFAERVRAREDAFKRIRTFEESVNRFLEHKVLRVNAAAKASRTRVPSTRMITLDGGRTANLSVLSSGERHVLTLLFSATHMSEVEGVLLIDEPELSLHVDWQRIILSELMKQAGERQIIACTHAPEVTADHRETMVALDVRHAAQ